MLEQLKVGRKSWFGFISLVDVWNRPCEGEFILPINRRNVTSCKDATFGWVLDGCYQDVILACRHNLEKCLARTHPQTNAWLSVRFALGSCGGLDSSEVSISFLVRSNSDATFSYFAQSCSSDSSWESIAIA